MAIFDIIVPTHRRPGELAQALASVRDQTFADWTCWIAEDGDTAETRETAKAFLEDTRFKYIPGVHAGLPAVPRNHAIRLGTAPYIAFLDDDDLWAPEKLEAQFSFFHRHPQAILVASNALRWPGDAPWYTAHDLLHPWSPARLVSFGNLLRSNVIINSSAVASRAALSRVGPLSEEPRFRGFEDYQYWLRLAPLGEIWIMEEALAIYRDQPRSSIRSEFQLERLHATLGALYISVLEPSGDFMNPFSLPENARMTKACLARGHELAGRESAIRKSASPQIPTENSPRQILRKSKQWATAKTFGAALEAYLKKRDLVMISREERADLARPAEAFAAIQAARARHEMRPVPQRGHCCECVVFSMDRALQLHALLSSMRELVAPEIPVHIIHHASTARHRQAYDDVAALFADPSIHFIPQRDGASFRDDLLIVLEYIAAPRVFFLVDDIVFTEAADLSQFCAYDTDAHVPSLRMGLDISRSYTMQQDLFPPDFLENPPGTEDKIFWRWEHGQNDWNYPLSVDGHIFATWEIKAMARQIDFKAPNSFEGNLQLFRPLFACRNGVSYKKSRIVNIACNKVQTENENIFGGVHQDFLLEQWEKGFQMDYRSLAGVAHESPQAEIPFRLIRRISQS